MKIPLSIVITTYNREKELRRCIESIIKQSYDEYEIVIIDDHSVPNYKNNIIKDFPNVKYFYQQVNTGPGHARNLGIKEAKYNYIVIMDDDDVFVNDAFECINNFLVETEEQDLPVYNFLRSNAIYTKKNNFSIFTFKDMVNGQIQGDLTPVINKRIFLKKERYMYPNSRIGAELLLWYRIAIEYGYPIVNKTIVTLMEDASQRLTDINRQINKASLFAEYQQDIINNFEKDIIKTGDIDYLIMRYRGAITYSLLGGNRRNSWKYFKTSLKYSKKQILFIPLFILPKEIIIKLFYRYRQ